MTCNWSEPFMVRATDALCIRNILFKQAVTTVNRAAQHKHNGIWYMRQPADEIQPVQAANRLTTDMRTGCRTYNHYRPGWRYAGSHFYHWCQLTPEASKWLHHHRKSCFLLGNSVVQQSEFLQRIWTEMFIKQQCYSNSLLKLLVFNLNAIVWQTNPELPVV